ncbi:Exodeoxyribonuclease I subunit D [Streptomyces sp. WMMB 714]|uniref:exonuclease SbcCD subunit D n=1 Tax=Streptomyces sp. WMMB 714 TaxID=1286822 RepID=UPI0005F852F6|nr:exonuclease SbcCD subunit D [Streptomyces sp. WMMB 714]SCK51980.1 Exodeoxyribonuclease I subunit D [Streptomyces sp. WMMB 714]
MRLLHTSDWHLGRSFHRISLLDAQRDFLDHLLATVEEERVDAVLVAGDVYDRAVPPLAAVELFDHALHRLAELGVPTVMISGNHDSARRLGVGSGLMRHAGIHLRTDPEGCGTPVVLPDEHGDVACYGLPYLEPALARAALGAREGGHTAVLGAAMERVREDLAARPGTTRSVVLAHAFVHGGESSDSERDITVGGVSAVPASVFDGVDYAALGHLHGCQTINDRVRYSGSPLAYSFSESGHRKSMWLVDLDAQGGVSARRLDCPVPRPLARIRGALEQLLEEPELARHEQSWVEATLTDPVRPHGAMATLAARFPHIVSIVFDPRVRDGGGEQVSYARRLRGRSDQQIAEDFVGHVRTGREPDELEREMLGEALEAARVEEAQEGDSQSGARDTTRVRPVTAGAEAAG